MASGPSSDGLGPAPTLTLLSGKGSSSLSYTLAGAETMLVEAVSVDIDAAAAGDTSVAVSYRAQSGETFAVSSTIALFPGGTSGEVSFAPDLPDSSIGGLPTFGPLLQTGLVAAELTGGCSIVIEATDAAAILTEGRVWATNTGADSLEEPPATLPVYLLPTMADHESELV